MLARSIDRSIDRPIDSMLLRTHLFFLSRLAIPGSRWPASATASTTSLFWLRRPTRQWKTGLRGRGTSTVRRWKAKKINRSLSPPHRPSLSLACSSDRPLFFFPFPGDILLLDYLEHYDLIWKKSLATFERGLEEQARFVMKCDDDTFVYIDQVDDQRNKRALRGCGNDHMAVLIAWSLRRRYRSLRMSCRR